MSVPVEAIVKIPYFSGLTGPELSQIQSLVTERSFERGEILFMEDDPCEGLFFVQSGHVKIYKASVEGKEQVLRIMRPGDSFNDVPVFDGGRNPATAEAMDKVVILFIKKQNVLVIVTRYPAVALAMLGGFAQRMRQLTHLVEDLSFRHVGTRLAKVLLNLAVDSDEASGRETDLRHRLTQQELAAMVGTAREVVSRSLREMEMNKLIRIERHRIVILDRKGLAEMLQ